MTSTVQQRPNSSPSDSPARGASQDTAIAALFAISREDLLADPARFEPLTDNLNAWIWETDVSQRFTFLTPSVARVTGLPPEMHYGRRLTDLGNVSIKTVDGRSWEDHLRSGESFGPKDFLCFHEARAFVIRTIAHPRFDGEGRYTGHCGIAVRLPSEKPSQGMERRIAERRRMVRAGELALAADGSRMSCVLLDVSITGARIQVPAEAALPPSLRLEVASLQLDRTCELRWRRDDQAGLEFVEA